ncbi:MAG: L-fucose isomerase [Acidobacteria bacterium]|nr:L-fucose isomerase [Acidobacteriota bacterium]
MIDIGLLSFSDGRERVHRDLSPRIAETARLLQEALEKTGEVRVAAGPEIVWRHAQAREQARLVAASATDGTIFNVPVFAFPNLVRIAATWAPPPFLAFSPIFGGLPGLGGLLGAAAGLEQAGPVCDKVYGSLEDPETIRRLMVFCRAAHAFNGLRGRVLGMIGGRSMGMVTGEANPDLYYSVFGLDVDHFDQSEILRQAESISEEDVERAFSWLQSRLGSIEYDGGKLVPAHLRTQIRHYIATKQIISQRQFDFVAVKCHYEMSEYHATQCLSAALMNDPYDWDGAKEPIVYACEADADGAVTMQILKLLTGKPVIFTDLRHYDAADDVMVLCNCGAMSTWYAARSDRPEENLAQVRLMPVIPKYGGGGGHVRFIGAEGPMTFARLFRRSGCFHMTIVQANLERYPDGKTEETCPVWPHLFAKLSAPAREFLPRLGSNHIHGVAGDVRAELLKFCELAGIRAEIW